MLKIGDVLRKKWTKNLYTVIGLDFDDVELLPHKTNKPADKGFSAETRRVFVSEDFLHASFVDYTDEFKKRNLEDFLSNT